MTASILIAKLLGPLLLVMGLVVTVSAAGVRALARDFIASPGLIFLAGILTLLGGLAIVATHNLWVADWRVIITLFGWLMIGAGIIRITLAFQSKSFGQAIADRMLDQNTFIRVAGGAMLILGGFLAWQGYF